MVSRTHSKHFSVKQQGNIEIVTFELVTIFFTYHQVSGIFVKSVHFEEHAYLVFVHPLGNLMTDKSAISHD